MFAAARDAETAGRLEDALVLLAALSADPDPEIRAEALFRRAMLLDAAGRGDEAAVMLHRLLDEKPDAAPVRLELARILARRGDEAGARRALRQAQAGVLPPDVAAVIDQFAAALRSRRSVGGSVQLALAPDSNVNRATDARTLDTVVAPLTLSRGARARSRWTGCIRSAAARNCRCPAAPRRCAIASTPCRRAGCSICPSRSSGPCRPAPGSG